MKTHIWQIEETNYWHSKSGTTSSLGVVKGTLADAKAWVDKEWHKEQEIKKGSRDHEFCDFCRAQWKSEDGGTSIGVDNDGAFVVTQISPCQIRDVRKGKSV